MHRKAEHTEAEPLQEPYELGKKMGESLTALVRRMAAWPHQQRKWGVEQFIDGFVHGFAKALDADLSQNESATLGDVVRRLTQKPLAILAHRSEFVQEAWEREAVRQQILGIMRTPVLGEDLGTLDEELVASLCQAGVLKQTDTGWQFSQEGLAKHGFFIGD